MYLPRPLCAPFDSADNGTSPLRSPPSFSSRCWSSLMFVFWPLLRHHRLPLIGPLLPSEAIVPPCCHLLWRGSLRFLSRPSVVARGVYTPNKLETVTPCPTLAVSCSLYLLSLSLSLSVWADFLLMALVDNCHKLPSWFQFPLSSPKFLALAWDKGMSTSKGSAKSLTPSRKGTAHNTVIESSYWSQGCSAETTAPVDVHTHSRVFMTAAEVASGSYDRPRPYNAVVKASPVRLSC